MPPSANVWIQAPNMNFPRRPCRATPIAGNKAFVYGTADPIAGAQPEIYDLATNTWSLAATGPSARYGQHMTTLADGRVLMAGGFIPGGPSTDASDIYDPVTNTWTATGPLPCRSAANGGFYADSLIQLPDGRVLCIACWTRLPCFNSSGVPGQINQSPNAFLFTPGPNTWALTGNLSVGRGGVRAVLLDSGKVLCVGGTTQLIFNPPPLTQKLSAAAELYDPIAGTWSLLPPMPPFGPSEADADSIGDPGGRWEHWLVKLPNGKVLVGGGINFYNLGGGGPNQIATRSSVLLFDPGNLGAPWSFVDNTMHARFEPASRLLANGKAIVGDGLSDSTTEVYDSAADTWGFDALLPQTNVRYTAADAGKTGFGVDNMIICGGAEFEAANLPFRDSKVTLVYKAGPGQNEPNNNPTPNPNQTFDGIQVTIDDIVLTDP